MAEQGTDILREKASRASRLGDQHELEQDGCLVRERDPEQHLRAKVNGIIPWACIQRPGKWVGGDPNPGTAFEVYDDGHYEVKPGYHFFKQVSRAGQPGMAVAQVVSNDSEIGLIAFAGRGSGNPDAFVILNMADHAVPLEIDVRGTGHATFSVVRTGPDETYVALDDADVREGHIAYEAPAGSVTTFTGT